jgi:hypothetical protein
MYRITIHKKRFLDRDVDIERNLILSAKLIEATPPDVPISVAPRRLQVF